MCVCVWEVGGGEVKMSIYIHICAYLCMQIENMQSQGLQYTGEKTYFYTKLTPLMQLHNPHAFNIRKEVQTCMTECVLIKSFKQSLHLAQFLPLIWGCKVSC